MDGNTTIGFCHATEMGYCKHCKKVFRYGYNAINGLRKGEGNCPKCGKGDKYGDIIRSDFIEQNIEMNRIMIHGNMWYLNKSDEEKEKIRKELRHEITKLNAIRRMFDTFEKEHE